MRENFGTQEITDMVYMLRSDLAGKNITRKIPVEDNRIEAILNDKADRTQSVLNEEQLLMNPLLKNNRVKYSSNIFS